MIEISEKTEVPKNQGKTVGKIATENTQPQLGLSDLLGGNSWDTEEKSILFQTVERSVFDAFVGKTIKNTTWHRTYIDIEFTDGTTGLVEMFFANWFSGILILILDGKDAESLGWQKNEKIGITGGIY